jgi:hypothetical protein
VGEGKGDSREEEEGDDAADEDDDAEEEETGESGAKDGGGGEGGDSEFNVCKVDGETEESSRISALASLLRAAVSLPAWMLLVVVVLLLLVLVLVLLMLLLLLVMSSLSVLLLRKESLTSLASYHLPSNFTQPEEELTR